MKRNLYILYAISLLQGMVFYAPVATLYRQAAGVGIFQITLIESISLAMMIGLEIPWGYVADRIGYRRTMVFCCSLYFLSKIVFWRAEGFAGFLLERIMLSVVCSGLSGVDSSMLYLSCKQEEAHRVFGIYQSLGELGIVLAAGVYALWIGANYRLAGFLTVISYGLAAVLALGLKEVKSRDREVKSGLRDMLDVLKGQIKNRKVLLLILAVALVNETHQSITVFLSQLQYLRAGMSHEMLSIAYILVSITGLIGGFSAKLCGKTGVKAMGSGLILLSVVCCLALGFTAVPVITVMAVVGLRGCFSLLQPMFSDLENRLVTTKDRATALSMNAVLRDGLGIGLNLVFGAAAEISLPGAIVLGGVVCLGSLLCFRGSKCFA